MHEKCLVVSNVACYNYFCTISTWMFQNLRVYPINFKNEKEKGNSCDINLWMI